MFSIHMKKQLAHFPLEISFEADREIVVLFGPSGSGKTTVLNCIAGLSHPDAGSITLNGVCFFDGKSRPVAPRRRNIGYLFQDYALFPHMTVEKNIRYGMKGGSSAHVDQLVEVLGIGHLLGKYPQQISGGEKQRVALARALATEPQMLLLDEPLSALDRKTRLQCQEELLRLHRDWNIPYVIVTHDLEEAKKLGDAIYFIERGQIVDTFIKRPVSANI
ncbi:ATP-binding cassette domain-containing protein [Brevibacillus sp. B_LB10_24]|uniref:ATP-binding cassette domain-containing protein n=1 Tax=Brevibacillus sp. B_LB10_24 TaxID=3380645 RepID=UPI0038BAAB7F